MLQHRRNDLPSLTRQYWAANRTNRYPLLDEVVTPRWDFRLLSWALVSTPGWQLGMEVRRSFIRASSLPLLLLLNFLCLWGGHTNKFLWGRRRCKLHVSHLPCNNCWCTSSYWDTCRRVSSSETKWGVNSQTREGEFTVGRGEIQASQLWGTFTSASWQ